MRIAFVGGGAIAKAIAHLAMKAGHEIVLGVRSPEKDDTAPFRRTTIEAALAGADLVMLAIPYDAAEEVLPSLAKHLSGSIVVDAINPVADDWSPIPTGEDSSAAERIQALLPGSKVVKGFNTIFADVVRADRLDRSGHKVTLFVAGDDADAKGRVMALGSEIGFSPLDAGPLKSARYLEGIAHLNIELAVGQGGGTNAAFVYDRAA